MDSIPWGDVRVIVRLGFLRRLTKHYQFYYTQSLSIYLCLPTTLPAQYTSCIEFAGSQDVRRLKMLNRYGQ